MILQDKISRKKISGIRFYARSFPLSRLQRLFQTSSRDIVEEGACDDVTEEVTEDHEGNGLDEFVGCQTHSLTGCLSFRGEIRRTIVDVTNKI